MVHREPRCVWEWNLERRQLDSINALDPDYFLFQIRLLSTELKTDDRFRAACGIRATYWHCLETFFALLFGALQAPHATYAWLLEYRPGDLPKLIDDIRAGRSFPVAFHLDRISWDSIASLVLTLDENDDIRSRDIHSGFSRAWSRLADEFTNKECRAEYNTIKHGLRLYPHGFTLAIAKPHRSVCGSEYGSQFFSRERIGKSAIHLQGRLQLLNWLPDVTCEKVELLVASLHNVKGFLWKMAKAMPSDFRFRLPDAAGVFDRPWTRSPGAVGMNLDSMISPVMIENFSPDDIRGTFGK